MAHELAIMVTGSTDGLGLGLAVRAAAAGHRVILHGRSEQRLTAAQTVVESQTGTRPEGVVGDFDSLAQVSQVAQRVAELAPALDVLVCNAGIGTGYPEGRERSESADGFELRWAVNYLAPVALTQSLLPQLEAADGGRVVLVASDGQLPIRFEDLMLEREYSGEQAYCQSKLALVAYGFLLAQQRPGSTVVSMHPGSFMATKIVVDDGAAVVDDLEGGVDALYRLSVDPEFARDTNQYFERTRRARAHPDAYDPVVGAKLWAVTQEQLAAAHPASDPALNE